MSTAIADPQLHELFHDLMYTHINGKRAQSFILALNERLQAAERLATACAVEHGQHDFEPECGVCYALAAYRKASQ